MAANWRAQLSLNLSTITVPFHSPSPLKVRSDAWDESHGAILVASRALSVGDSLSLGCHLKLLLLQSPCLPVLSGTPCSQTPRPSTSLLFADLSPSQAFIH